MPDQRFPKKERLKSRKRISEVFEKGNSFFKHPLRIIFSHNDLPGESTIEVAFSVPKRKISKAFMRNKLKRRMREAYRLNRSIFHEAYSSTKSGNLSMIFIYQHDKELNYDAIEKSLIKLMSKVLKESTKSKA